MPDAGCRAEPEVALRLRSAVCSVQCAEWVSRVSLLYYVEGADNPAPDPGSGARSLRKQCLAKSVFCVLCWPL